MRQFLGVLKLVSELIGFQPHVVNIVGLTCLLNVFSNCEGPVLSCFVFVVGSSEIIWD